MNGLPDIGYFRLPTSIPYRPAGSYAAADYKLHNPFSDEFLPDMQAVDSLYNANRLNQRMGAMSTATAGNQFLSEAPQMYDQAKREAAMGIQGPASKRFAALQSSLYGQNVADHNTAYSMRPIGQFVSKAESDALEQFKLNKPYRDEGRINRAEQRQIEDQASRDEQFQQKLDETKYAHDQEQGRVTQERMKQDEARINNKFNEAYTAIRNNYLNDPNQLQPLFPGLSPDQYARLKVYMGQNTQNVIHDYGAMQDEAANYNNEIGQARLNQPDQPALKALQAERDAAIKQPHWWDPRDWTADPASRSPFGGKIGPTEADIARSKREYAAQYDYYRRHPEELQADPVAEAKFKIPSKWQGSCGTR